MMLSETQIDSGVWVSPRWCSVSRSWCCSSNAYLNLNHSLPHTGAVHHNQNEDDVFDNGDESGNNDDNDDQGPSQLGKCKRNFNISFSEDNNSNTNASNNSNNNNSNTTMLQCCKGWEYKYFLHWTGQGRIWTLKHIVPKKAVWYKSLCQKNSRTHW